ncbi:tetratricopeptide repeat protein [Brevundimonas sp.]|uniref:tetratricopeptide repeat protein n=1 Tax=Brevundimonas sp. TaxID=1871086 RepID=UPI003AF9F9C3
MERLRGWKRIAAHLDVSPATAMRWARSADLPVVRSGNGRSVYALSSTLDDWMAASTVKEARGRPVPTGVAPATPAAVVAMPPAGPLEVKGRWRRQAVSVLAIAFFGIVLMGLSFNLASARPEPGPLDREVEALYLDARVEWAERTPDSLERATQQYLQIIALKPDFAPAFSGLADVHILSCEFGGADRGRAFEAARAAVRTALELDRSDADANRAAGFLRYWTTRDLSLARPFFERALRERPNDHLIHLWYGNILVDAGEVDEGVRHLRLAVRLAPNSPAVLTDYAIGLWQSGDRTGAMARLGEVLRRFPDYSGAPNFAALFSFQSGDVTAYLAHSTRWATLIQSRDQLERVEREREAYRRGGAEALLRSVARAKPMQSNSWHGGNLQAAVAAALLGDRDLLLARLRATSASEDWRNLRFPADSFVSFRGDPEVSRELRRLIG